MRMCIFAIRVITTRTREHTEHAGATTSKWNRNKNAARGRAVQTPPERASMRFNRNGKHSRSKCSHPLSPKALQSARLRTNTH